MDEYGKHSSRYAADLNSDIKGSARRGGKIVKKGTKLTGQIWKGTDALAKKELAYSGRKFKEAWGAFVQGNLHLAERTKEDRHELVSVPGDYYNDLKEDFSNIYELTGRINQKVAGSIDDSWERAFEKAGREFRSEYERSGEKKNSLLALGPILYGYLKAFYEGLVAPASRTIVKRGVQGTATAVFLPVATVSVITGRTVQATGLTVYYIGKTGVKVISPTVEGGLLSGMAILSAGAVPVTYAAGGSLSAVNQVAFTAGGPGYAALEATATSSFDTAKYVGSIVYDTAKGTTKVVINQASSGVVLGYNALTAIPAHLLTGVMDGVIFLAWDGPRLVVAAAKGDLQGGGGAEGDGTTSVGNLPVGTVVDLEKLREADGVEVEIVSEEPSVIGDVIRKLPCDLRENGGECK